MDTGEVMDMLRERISNMSGINIADLFNREMAGCGEKLIYEQDSNFMLEVPKTNDLSEINVETRTITCDECDLENPSCNQCGGTRGSKMSNAWEVTDDDIEHVLSEHGKTKVQIASMLTHNVIDAMDYDRVEKSILYYTDMDDQIQCSYSEIEDILIEEALLVGPKLFNCPR